MLMHQNATTYTTYLLVNEVSCYSIKGQKGTVWLLPKVCKVQPTHKKGLLELQARGKLNSVTLECKVMLRTPAENS